MPVLAGCLVSFSSCGTNVFAIKWSKLLYLFGLSKPDSPFFLFLQFESARHSLTVSLIFFILFPIFPPNFRIEMTDHWGVCLHFVWLVLSVFIMLTKRTIVFASFTFGKWEAWSFEYTFGKTLPVRRTDIVCANFIRMRPRCFEKAIFGLTPL